MAASIATPAVRPARRLTVVRDAAPQPAAPEHAGPLGLGGLRLTRRGRLVVALLALLLAAPLLGLGARAMASGPGRPTEVEVHTVAPGETLWGFARKLAAPGEDVRDAVARLRDLNELRSVELRVGQTVLIPRE